MMDGIAVDASAMVCVIIAVGMSVAFLVADSRSTTTRLLAVFFVAIGISILFNIIFVRPYDPAEMPWPSRIAPLLTMIAMIAAAEWMLRIRRTVPAGKLQTWQGDSMFRIAQGMGIVYGVVGFTLNEWRARYFVGRLHELSALADWHAWLFILPLGLGVLALVDGTLMTLRRKPDRPEAVRLFGIAVSAPLIASGLVLPTPWASYGSAMGQMIFLIAAVQYHVLQGQRGEFLKRFLAPSVADLVRRRGLETAMQRRKLEISAVAIDIRGYTSFAETRDSFEVVDILHQFYDLVGEQARRYGATIKDYAGDGVLLLLGAPIEVDDYAIHAVELARAMQQSLDDAFTGPEMPLGAGIGIATGTVSVGVIGEEKLEYVAVGKAINLAGRLCDHARAGEILVDERTRELIGDSAGLSAAPEMEFKGITGTVTPWQVSV